MLTAGPEPSAQRNAGAEAAAASIIGFVVSDMTLSPTVVEEVVVAIGAGAASVVVPETTGGEGFLARVSEYERNFYEESASIEIDRERSTKATLRVSITRVNGIYSSECLVSLGSSEGRERSGDE